MAEIDLSVDFDAVRKHLAQRARDYAQYANEGPGDDDDPVTLITLGFAFDQSGYIALVFDTRTDAESDGQWQSYIGENEHCFDHWHDAVHPLHEATAFGGECEPLLVKSENGQVSRYDQYDDVRIATDIGMMLWRALVDACRSGLFAALPLAKNCTMSVEEQDGCFGWPTGDDDSTPDLVAAYTDGG